MSDSPHLGLAYLAPSQAQKHVTVNEALRRLDALVQLGVLDRTRTAPPASPEEGDRHIVAAGATGLWAGQGGRIAAWLDGVWTFIAPRPGWLAYTADEGELIVFLDGDWVSALAALSSLEALDHVGINATADPVNRLAVASEAALFTHDGAGVQVKLNKAAASDTASLLFQDGYSGRAEFGLAGSDALSLKVSADGSSWTSALTVDPATGAVDLPASPMSRIDRFTSSGVWTKPAWASRVKVMLVGGGAGGGSGALRPAGTAASGGSGGGPGVVVEGDFQAADLTATVAVTIGAGGVGGAAQTTAGADGVAGTAGGATSFGSYLRSFGGGAGFGLGGSGVAVSGGVTSGQRCLPPSADVSGGQGALAAGGTGVSGPGRLGAGGGGGGGLSAANAEAAGGASGIAAIGVGYYASSSAAGSAPGGAGAAGVVSSLIASVLAPGGSGGGGASGSAVAGGAGGAGAAPGGSGGGGGAGRNGLSSGKGGNGARGEAWIISMR